MGDPTPRGQDMSSITHDESFFLTKNNYDESTKTILKSMHNDAEFTDVTLACKDQKQVRSHKAILGASSGFFRNIFKENAVGNLVLYLKGVSHQDLSSILEFIYIGQTSVNKANLTSFLEAAEELKIDGLIQPNTENVSVTNTSSNIGTSTASSTAASSYESVPEVTIDESPKTEMTYSSSSYATTSMESEYNSILETSTSVTENSANDSTELTFTVTPEFSSTMLPTPTVAEPPSFPCDVCGQKYADPGNLKRHKTAAHKTIKKEIEPDLPFSFNATTQQYSCNVCVFTSVYRRSAMRHCDNSHGLKVSNASSNISNTISRESSLLDSSADTTPTSVPSVPDAIVKEEVNAEGKKKHLCPQCDFTTIHRSSMMRHMSTLHGLEMKSPESNANKKYSCFACEFKTDHSSSLKRHIEGVHEGKKSTE